MLHFTWAAAVVALLLGNVVESERTMLCRELTEALSSVEKQQGGATNQEALGVIASKVARSLGEWSEAGNLLESALRRSRDGDAETIEKAVREALEILTFEPVVESPMPDGFPATTAVGEIELKSYPKYRMARTSMKGSDNSAFFTLFRHIQSNEISMTAPVEMTYPRESDIGESVVEPTMAFLYGPGVTEKPETAGSVEIVEVAPLTVVSIGSRGRRSAERTAWAKERIREWLQAKHPELEVTGPLRVLGYNSPFVPTSDRYFEIQLEVRPITKTEVF